MKTVVIESPYAGTPEEIERNVRYAKAAVRYCLDMGYAPYASHLFFTQPELLRDEVHAERRLGIKAGLAIGDTMDERWVFSDLGITAGMKEGIERAEELGQQTVLIAGLGPEWWPTGWAGGKDAKHNLTLADRRRTFVELPGPTRTPQAEETEEPKE